MVGRRVQRMAKISLLCMCICVCVCMCTKEGRAHTLLDETLSLLDGIHIFFHKASLHPSAMPLLSAASKLNDNLQWGGGQSLDENNKKRRAWLPCPTTRGPAETNPSLPWQAGYHTHCCQRLPRRSFQPVRGKQERKTWSTFLALREMFS